MRNILLEVRNIRRCDGGHTCTLSANGRRVAFVAPNILEWTNHSQMVDVLAWFEFNKMDKSAQADPEPVLLTAGWEKSVPDYLSNDHQDLVQKTLLEWIDLHVQAYEITLRKELGFAVKPDGSLVHYPAHYSYLFSDFRIDNNAIVLRSDMTVSTIFSILESRHPYFGKRGRSAS
jgi:hypothetical protein